MDKIIGFSNLKYNCTRLFGLAPKLLIALETPSLKWLHDKLAICDAISSYEFISPRSGDVICPYNFMSSRSRFILVDKVLVDYVA